MIDGAPSTPNSSRGAAHCDFVDSSSNAVNEIRNHLVTLEAQHRGSCHRLEALAFLEGRPGPWDILFLDPPFGADLLQPVCEALAEGAYLAPGALVYIETGQREALPPLPPDWQLHRDKQAGEVAYRLFIVGSGQKG